jgi:hypothetical protein
MIDIFPNVANLAQCMLYCFVAVYFGIASVVVHYGGVVVVDLVFGL